MPTVSRATYDRLMEAYFTTRTANALRRSGYMTLEDVASADLNVLAAKRTIGTKTLAEVELWRRTRPDLHTDAPRRLVAVESELRAIREILAQLIDRIDVALATEEET